MCNIVAPDEIVSRVDIVAAFGGDGTFLYASRLVAASGVPIIGINLGSLGFLTEVKVEEMRIALDRVLSGDYSLENRMLLEVEVMRAGRLEGHYLALNDAVINKGALARIIELEVTVNDDLVTLARADGLIISSPTGSTAYSLSAGGPILYPTLEAFLITPICPHMLTNRPVVVPDNASVAICLRHGRDVMLTVDGQVGVPLQSMDVLKVRRAAPVIRLVQATGTTFFHLLREKLKWS
jgi:NAD+ kinase